jgi:subtilisin
MRTRSVVGLAVLLMIAVVFPIAPSAASSGKSSSAAEKQRYVVVLEDTIPSAAAVAEEHRRNGAEVSHVYESALKGYAATMTEARAAAVSRDPRVESVQPDGVVESLAQPVPTGVDRIDGELSSTRAGDGAGAVNVPVAVIDTGIDPSHRDLNVKGGKDCTLGGLSYNDLNGHGSHVAGTIGAKDDATGVVGVAPGTPLYAVRVLDASGSGLNSWVICGIDWVTANGPSRGIKVANMSLGGAGTDHGSCGAGRDAMHKAICNSVAKGITYVVAAGNDDADLKDSTPAAYDEVLTVTAVTDYDGTPRGGGASTCRSGTDDTAADYSNWTTASHPDVAHTVAGPGTCIYSTSMFGGYSTLSGTSMASPHIAGLVALCISSGDCAGLSPAQIIAKIRSDAAAQPASYGFGGDPSRPIGSRYYGHLASAAGY